jgi:hypothetical protein
VDVLVMPGRLGACRARGPRAGARQDDAAEGDAAELEDDQGDAGDEYPAPALHDPNSDNYAHSTFTNIHFRYYF